MLAELELELELLLLVEPILELDGLRELLAVELVRGYCSAVVAEAEWSMVVLWGVFR